MTESKIVLTGVIGLIAAILTGVGEFLLHFDAQARFAENQFFLGIDAQRTNWGHFFGALGGPLYLIGCWHIQQMLRPANPRWAMTAFWVMAYGFVVGLVWIGSRATLSALMNSPEVAADSALFELYDLRYETLLQVIRLAVLVLSIIYVALVLTGRSHYPKWMAVLNPILLIVASFLVYLAAPSIGKYVMPIALNVAFAIFFIASIFIAKNKNLGVHP